MATKRNIVYEYIDFETTNISIIVQITFFDPLLNWHGVPCLKLNELSFSLSLMGALTFGLK
jgi:hypothetical protein